MIKPIERRARLHEILVARYQENATQARHHEALRERTTSMVASTSGVMLGLFGFKESSFYQSPVSTVIACFIVALGIWGLYSCVVTEARIRRHRMRINAIRERMDRAFVPSPPTKTSQWVWLAFHSGVVLAGIALLAMVWFCPACSTARAAAASLASSPTAVQACPTPAK